MEEYSLVLENPRRRRRRRTPPRGAGGRFRKRASSRRRRRNPVLASSRRNPVRRRRRARRRNYGAMPAYNPRRRRASSRRRTTRRRRNPGLFPGRGELMGAVRKGTQIVVAEFAGDLATRVVGRFAGTWLMSIPMRQEFLAPVVRMVVGVGLPPLMKNFAPKLFKKDFRQMFAAVNVASGLMSLTSGFREQAFAALKLPSSADTLAGYYGPPTGVLGDYYGPPAGVLGDYVTADGGLGDYVTADGGVGY